MELATPAKETLTGEIGIKRDEARAQNPETLFHALSKGEQTKLSMLYSHLEPTPKP